MARLTSKYQLTLPKAVAERAGLRPGDEVDCEPAGEIIRVRSKKRTASRSVTDRLVLFDLATERQRHREDLLTPVGATERGWTRDELYEP
jgi:AbrB family looped-hinge helix DNA binding protein